MLVTHEVVETAVGELRVMQKRKVGRGQSQCGSVMRVACDPHEHHDQRTRHIVGAVAGRTIRNAFARVLDDPDVVGEGQHVIERRERASHPPPDSTPR